MLGFFDTRRSRSRRGQASYPQAHALHFHAGPLSLQTQSQGTEPEHSTGLRLLLYQYKKPYHHGCPNTESEALLEKSSKDTGDQRRDPHTLEASRRLMLCTLTSGYQRGEKKCQWIRESIERVTWRHPLPPARGSQSHLTPLSAYAPL